MARAKYTNVDKAMAWARSVLKGKFPACLFIHQAIERHFDDLAASRSKDYVFNRSLRSSPTNLAQLAQLVAALKADYGIA